MIKAKVIFSNKKINPVPVAVVTSEDARKMDEVLSARLKELNRKMQPDPNESTLGILSDSKVKQKVKK